MEMIEYLLPSTDRVPELMRAIKMYSCLVFSANICVRTRTRTYDGEKIRRSWLTIHYVVQLPSCPQSALIVSSGGERANENGKFELQIFVGCTNAMDKF